MCSEAVIALTVTAVATGIPEIAATLVAIRRGYTELALGNIVGSNLINLGVVLGLTGLVAPVAGASIGLAAIVMLVATAVHNKKMPDEELLPFFDKLEEHACDGRNFVKKAVNWLLRQLGKRSLFLHPHAIACGERLLAMDCPAAKWSARDALRELHSEKVMERLLAKEARKKK